MAVDLNDDIYVYVQTIYFLSMTLNIAYIYLLCTSRVHLCDFLCQSNGNIERVRVPEDTASDSILESLYYYNVVLMNKSTTHAHASCD